MIDSTLSTSAPAKEGVLTVILEIPCAISTLSLDVVNFPLKLRESIPFASEPLVEMYATLIKFGSCNANPNIPSPNINSYFSSAVS